MASSLLASASAWLHQSESGHLLFYDHGVIIRLHSVGHRQHEQGVRIIWLGFQCCLGHCAGAVIGGQKSRIAVLSRRAFRAVQELFVVQKKLRRENSLGIELFIEVACGFGSTAHRVGGILFLVREKIGARTLEIQFVEAAKPVIEQGGRGTAIRRSRWAAGRRHSTARATPPSRMPKLLAGIPLLARPYRSTP